MTDFDAFQQAVSNENSYISGLTRSMSLVLDEFYGNLRSVGVSSMTGQGVDDLFKAVDEAKLEYLRYVSTTAEHQSYSSSWILNVLCVRRWITSDYRPYFEKRMQEKANFEQQQQDESMSRLDRDLAADRAAAAGSK
jgi:GPN-loop GTPase